MALNLKLKVIQSGDCKKLTITDVTENYGVGGNPDKTDFDDNADQYGFNIIDPLGINTPFIYSGNNPVFSTSDLFSTGIVFAYGTNGAITDNPLLFGNQPLIDGNWQIKYTLRDADTDTTYTVSKNLFLTCNLECAYKKELLKIAEDYCLSKCDYKAIDRFMELELYHKALADAVMCGNLNGAKKLYKLLSKQFNIDCDCGCN